jgi:type IV pilus assembly protein PilX
MDTPMNSAQRNGQRGAVLVIALLFLTILTILGVTAMTSTTFEERLAGNARDNATAFQAAEAALRDARRDLNSIFIAPATIANTRNPPISGKTGFGDGVNDSDNGKCGISTTAPQTLGLCRPLVYDASNGVPPSYNSNFYKSGQPSGVRYGTYTGAPDLQGVSSQPSYYIEVMCLPQYGGSLGDPNYCNFYRITGRGWGLNPNTVVTVQEIFLKM